MYFLTVKMELPVNMEIGMGLEAGEIFFKSSSSGNFKTWGLLESRFGVHDVATNCHSRGIVSDGLSNTQTVRGPDILWIVFCKMWDRDFNPDSASYIEFPI